MRLIDADALIQHKFANPISYNAFVNLVKRQPTIQPEVVRCRDCKWYDITHPYGTIVPNAFHCKVNDRFYEASHFCGYGERRE